jgi:hypothetical protein
VSEQVGSPPPAEVAASFENADLRGRLASDDWGVREQAQKQLSAIYQRAYGDAPAEEPGPAQMGLPSNSVSHEMMRPSGGAELEVASDQIPPMAEGYVSPQSFRADPEFVGLFQSWAHSAQLTQTETVEVVEAIDRFDREGASIVDWPPHLQEQRVAMVAASFNATPEGRAELARARGVFAEIKRTHPGLAELIEAAGAGADPDVISALARLARG